jgi:hypothetical protein
MPHGTPGPAQATARLGRSERVTYKQGRQQYTDQQRTTQQDRDAGHRQSVKAWIAGSVVNRERIIFGWKIITSPAAQQPSAGSHCRPPDSRQLEHDTYRANPHDQYEKKEFHDSPTGVSEKTRLLSGPLSAPCFKSVTARSIKYEKVRYLHETDMAAQSSLVRRRGQADPLRRAIGFSEIDPKLPCGLKRDDFGLNRIGIPKSSWI